MTAIIIETAVDILAELTIMLIGVAGAWLTMQLAKYKSVETINAAQQEVITMAQITVGELSQTVADKLKAASEDGKLTSAEIQKLGLDLITLTYAKLSEPTRKLLRAAKVDVTALIRGAGEDWINSLKKGA
ncbi:MAG: hypothetical protein IIX72_00600 [Oscillospiraceae bacterium]|nr:hypothetical protein [Oscillospiraceae bacterium]